jgi:hypothetical protein
LKTVGVSKVLELDFIEDMVEEQLAKGNLRWLANFNEIHRDYAIGDTVFPLYATGGLQEKGFFLSRIYSAFVTPRYRIHFLLYTNPDIDPKFLRKIILMLKSKFGEDDWVFLGLVQSRPFEGKMKDAVKDLTEKNIGVAAFSLSSKDKIFSDNVLGKGLAKNLKLNEVQFEVFDLISYLKSFTIVLFFGFITLLVIGLSGLPQALNPITVLFMAGFSLIIAYQIYKSRFHTTLTLSSKGFQLKEGTKVKERNWASYSDVTIYITPKHETCLRLHSKDETFDLPVSRAGVSRREAYKAVKQFVMRNRQLPD